LPRALANLAGRKLGRWTVVARAENGRGGNTMWLCQCDCGSEPSPVYANHLKGGRSKSCGCLHREIVSGCRGDSRRAIGVPKIAIERKCMGDTLRTSIERIA
jgi:hypothetical protein